MTSNWPSVVFCWCCWSKRILPRCIIRLFCVCLWIQEWTKWFVPASLALFRSIMYVWVREYKREPFFLSVLASKSNNVVIIAVPWCVFSFHMHPFHCHTANFEFHVKWESLEEKRWDLEVHNNSLWWIIEYTRQCSFAVEILTGFDWNRNQFDCSAANRF